MNPKTIDARKGIDKILYNIRHNETYPYTEAKKAIRGLVSEMDILNITIESFTDYMVPEQLVKEFTDRCRKNSKVIHRYFEEKMG